MLLLLLIPKMGHTYPSTGVYLAGPYSHIWLITPHT